MPNVLILGATSAIAAEVARRYAARGERLFLVGRNPEKLERLAEDLGDAAVGYLAADLTETQTNAQRVDHAIAALGSVDIALVAHGLLGDPHETQQDWHAAREVFEVNLLSVVSLLIPVARAMEAQGSGHIAVLSSVAGERGRPRNYTYGAAKGAVTLYLQGLRSRLWRRGVSVHTIKLGPVDTPMTATHPKNLLFATAARVADGIVANIDGPPGERFLPRFWRPVMGVVRNLPEPLFQRVRALSGAASRTP